MYNKPTAINIILSEELKAFPPDRMPTLTTFIQHCTRMTATAVKQEKEIKGIQIEEEKVKLSYLQIT